MCGNYPCGFTVGKPESLTILNFITITLTYKQAWHYQICHRKLAFLLFMLRK